MTTTATTPTAITCGMEARRTWNQTSPSFHCRTCPPPKVMQTRRHRTKKEAPPIQQQQQQPHLPAKSLHSLEEVTHFLESSSETKIPLDSSLYNSLVSICISNKALYEGSQLHSHMARTGHKPSIFLENQFINLYAKCGDMEAALEVFNRMLERNCVSWNAMISGYCLNQQFQEAFSLFSLMSDTGSLLPNKMTFLCVLTASVGSGNQKHGRQIHAHVIKTGLYQDVKLGNALINMYAKLGNLESAETVYESMVEWDEVTWNSLITAYAQNGCSNQAMVLFSQMQLSGLGPNEFAFGTILKSCNVEMVRVVHGQIIKSSYDSNVFAMTSLVNAYARDQNLGDAYRVFSRMPERNIVAWNAMIAAYIEHRCIEESLELFVQMKNEAIDPDKFTIANLVKGMAIQSQPGIEEGKQLHVLAIKSGSCTDTLVGNNLITMYSKHGEFSCSLQAFANIEKPDLISWNSMLYSYVQNERFEQALVFFQEMKLSGTIPDEFTYVGILEACTTLGWYQTGKAVYGSLIKTKGKKELNALVGSSLVDMYSKNGFVLEAEQVFDEIELKDLIAWNSMIVGFLQNSDAHNALKLFSSMRIQNLEPDNFTFAAILSACSDAMAIQQGRQVHCLILKSRVTADIAVANALITMYSNFGNVEEAEKVFYRLEMSKTLVTWTAMIACYAQNGRTCLALALFNQMDSLEIKPNGITFVALLTACSHAGFTKQAENYFELMKEKYGIKPGLEHYACMVDILARAGRLEEAENLIEDMPYKPNALVWRMLLSACRGHGDLPRGERSMKRILELEPGDSAAYVLLSNIYAAHGRWKDVFKVRKLMKENGVQKEVGKSWIEVDNVIHEFEANDNSHPQTHEIHVRLHELFMQMKLGGYMVDPDSVLHEMDFVNDQHC